MLNQAVDPNTDPLIGAGMKALGLAGLITHPLAFFPTGDEWRERAANAGNTGRMGQAIAGALGDLPSIVDPHLLAGGGALAAAPLIGKLAGKADDAGDVVRAYHGTDKAFDQFDPSKTRDGAFHFNNSPDVATRYAMSRAMDNGKGANVRPVDLIMKNPKKVDIASRQEIEAAKAEGFDGVIGKDGHYVVFDSSQIRSPFDQMSGKVDDVADAGRVSGMADKISDLKSAQAAHMRAADVAQEMGFKPGDRSTAYTGSTYQDFQFRVGKDGRVLGPDESMHPGAKYATVRIRSADHPEPASRINNGFGADFSFEPRGEFDERAFREFLQKKIDKMTKK
jgi:hypothetical protein